MFSYSELQMKGGLGLTYAWKEFFKKKLESLFSPFLHFQLHIHEKLKRND